jgi:hypothetical protein
MKTLALVTSTTSLPIDYDMPLLLDAFASVGIQTQVCDWEDQIIDWSRFDGALLRSPWNYVERLDAFLSWCARVESLTRLFNPLAVARWSLDKRYLADLAAKGVPTVSTAFVDPNANPHAATTAFLAAHPKAEEIVVKPTIGAYSKDVRRFARGRESAAADYVARLLNEGHHVMIQPYLASIDRDGETNLAYFDGQYSHAIRKGAMLMADGTVHVPTQDLRAPRVADRAERVVADAALAAAAAHLKLSRPLLYARVDLIRGNDGQPVVLELEICEPSLNLPFAHGSPLRFAQAVVQRLND